MSKIVLYGIPGSPYLRSAQMALEEKSLPYSVEIVSLRGPARETYLERQPFGRIPAMQHDSFKLYETQAMVRYFDALKPEPTLQPSQPKAIGQMNQIIGINDWYLFPKVGAVIVFNRIIGPAMFNHTPDEAAIEGAMPIARTCFTELERLLGDNEFLAGDRLSLADIMLAPQVDFLAATPEGRQLLDKTRLADWLARMNTRTSMQKTARPDMLNAPPKGA